MDQRYKRRFVVAFDSRMVMMVGQCVLSSVCRSLGIHNVFRKHIHVNLRHKCFALCCIHGQEEEKKLTTTQGHTHTHMQPWSILTAYMTTKHWDYNALADSPTRHQNSLPYSSHDWPGDHECETLAMDDFCCSDVSYTGYPWMMLQLYLPLLLLFLFLLLFISLTISFDRLFVYLQPPKKQKKFSGFFSILGSEEKKTE